MKKFIYGLLAFSLMTGCDDNDDKKGDSQKITEIENTVTTGKWKITLFSEDGIVETADYTDYEFTFTEGTPSNAISAADGANTYSGSWSITDDNSNDDSNDFEDLDFNITFSTSSSPPVLAELNEDWEIISRTDTKIELKHISGGGGGTDLLSFEKII
ncbi:MAG: hypothetical protein ACXWCT_14105 [Flavitalea sp.]